MFLIYVLRRSQKRIEGSMVLLSCGASAMGRSQKRIEGPRNPSHNPQGQRKGGRSQKRIEGQHWVRRGAWAKHLYGRSQKRIEGRFDWKVFSFKMYEEDLKRELKVPLRINSNSPVAPWRSQKRIEGGLYLLNRLFKYSRPWRSQKRIEGLAMKSTD